MITEREVVIGELAAWAAHRSRRVATRTATKNQLLGQLDRAFPGLTLALPDVLGTKIGRLVAAEFADPARLSALGVNRLIRFAAARDIQLRRPVAERLVAAARDALPTRDAVVARRVLAADMALLADLDSQIQVPRPNWPAATTQPVRHVDLGARLGCGPGIQLRCCPGGSDPVAGTASDLPRVGTVPDAVRIRRQTPRRNDQPRGQRGAAPRADRSRHRTVAHRARGQGLRPRTQSPRQARRDHRLRAGTSRHPHRPRPGPRPRRLRLRPLGLEPQTPTEKGRLSRHPSQHPSVMSADRQDEGPDQMPYAAMADPPRVTP